MKSNKWQPASPKCRRCQGTLVDYSAIDGVNCEEACTNVYCSLYGQEQCQELLDQDEAILAYFGGPGSYNTEESDHDDE